MDRLKQPVCKACKEHYRKYPLVQIEDSLTGKPRLVHKYSDNFISDPRRCAFTNGVFDSNNWGCETLLRLRLLCGEQEEDLIPKWARYYCRCDIQNGSIGVLWIPEDSPQHGYLVMNWYKSRYSTDKAYVLVDDEDKKPELLALPTAEFILDYYTREYHIKWEF